MDVKVGRVWEEDASFFTWIFIIRYCDEEIELNDLCCFRSEVYVDGDYLKTEFFVETELNFVDMSKLNAKQLNEQIDEVISTDPLKGVSTLEFKLLNVPQGVSEFLPVVFDTSYFCQFNCTVHSSLLDYRFRQRPLKQFWIYDQEDDDEGPFDQLTETDFFFADEDGKVPDYISLKDVDWLVDEYYKILIKMFDKQKQKLENFIETCMDADQK